MTDKHPLDAHARAAGLDCAFENDRNLLAAVLRVELTREPSTGELDEAISWLGVDRSVVRDALKAAMAQRLKALRLD